VVAISPGILLAIASLLIVPWAQAWVVLIPLLMPAFCLAGVFQSLALRAFLERAGVLYAADLCGGAAGALFSVVMINTLGGPLNTALALSIVTAAGAWFFVVKNGSSMPQAARRLIVPAAAVSMALAIAVVVMQYTTEFLDIDYTRTPNKLISKILRPTPAGIPRLLRLQSRWDASSRVDIIEEPDLCRPEAVQRTVFIDGEVPSAMIPTSEIWSPHNCRMLIRDSLPALPYRLFSPAAVLCIGPGGGYDVVVARLFGTRKIDAVELNAGVLSVVENARDFTGNIYAQEGVHVVHGEGRQFVRSAADESYDLVVMALAQSLMSNLAEYALSENYLYTSEAFVDYLRVLRPGGAIAVMLYNNKLLPRLSATAQQSLDRQGYPGRECVVALSSEHDAPYNHIVVAKKGAYSAVERDALAQQIRQYRYRITREPNGLEQRMAQETASLHEGRMLDTIPATDDRPFFFHITQTLPPGLVIFLSVSLIMLIGALSVLCALHAREPGRLPAVAKQAGYFVCLGLAFMMVEVLVLQKTIFIIGFPTLNLAIILAVFLLAAGMGSAVTGFLMHTTVQRRLPMLVLIVGLSLTVVVPLLDLFKSRADSLSLVSRCVAMCGMLFPFAFVMGMPFPLAIRLLPKGQSAFTPWLWGLNGIASILGSAVAVTLVLYMGFQITALVPVFLYCLASAFAFSFSGKSSDSARGERLRPNRAGRHHGSRT
jgi:spermidine synthase